MVADIEAIAKIMKSICPHMLSTNSNSCCVICWIDWKGSQTKVLKQYFRGLSFSKVMLYLLTASYNIKNESYSSTGVKGDTGGGVGVDADSLSESVSRFM